jgi:hypothetical protein
VDLSLPDFGIPKPAIIHLENSRQGIMQGLDSVRGIHSFGDPFLREEIRVVKKGESFHADILPLQHPIPQHRAEFTNRHQVLLLPNDLNLLLEVRKIRRWHLPANLSTLLPVHQH